MRITLSLYHQSAKIDEFVLDEATLVIGRAEDADITLNDRWVSRRHCCMEVVDGAVVVRDLGSRHGTRVNDRPVKESKLLPGDTLGVGLSRFVASYSDEAAVRQDGREATSDA